MKSLKFIFAFVALVGMIQVSFGQYRPRPGRFPLPLPARFQQVCFYEDNNFQGASYCAFQGRDIQNFVNIKLNDKVSSIAIPQGVTVTVYEDAYYVGRRLTLTSSVSNVSRFRSLFFNWNDRVSSASIGR